MGLIDEKTEGEKSRATVPLRKLHASVGYFDTQLESLLSKKKTF
jgi:hypothetical protein